MFIPYLTFTLNGGWWYNLSSILGGGKEGSGMKRIISIVLVIMMVMFLVNPLSSDAHGRFGHGDDWDEGYVWVPLTVIAGVLVVWAATVWARYHSPYYAPPPVVIQERPPMNFQPAPSIQPSTAERLFIYPRKGQSEELQAKDRYECHSRAVSQSQYDPDQPPSGMPEAQLYQIRADYQRVMGACLDDRGYTVK